MAACMAVEVLSIPPADFEVVGDTPLGADMLLQLQSMIPRYATVGRRVFGACSQSKEEGDSFPFLSPIEARLSLPILAT